jgi:hypothetical protein
MARRRYNLCLVMSDYSAHTNSIFLSNIHMLTHSPNGLFHPLFTGYLPAYTWFAFTQTNTWQYISIRMPTALTTR